MNSLITAILNGIMNFANDALMPVMVLSFLAAVALRFLIHYSVKREEWFAKAFQKRVYDYLLNKNGKKHTSFFVATKFLLEKTYYELFVLRAILKRRNPDIIMDKTDRIFLVQQGCARIVKDTLKHVQFFRYDMHRPRTMDITVQIFEKNPQFNNVLGYIPIGTTNDILNILPGIFIVGGIFGTFLGIMAALPELGAMDLADIEKSKQVMDHFLVKMSYSMITSILGIILNVSLSFLNAFLNPKKTFVESIERFDNALDTLWSACSDNMLPSEIPDFDEHKDPLEALAESAVDKEVQKDKAYVLENQSEDEEQVASIGMPDVPQDDEDAA